MGIDFPVPSSVGEIFSAPNNINYQYDGTKWTTQIKSNNSSIGSNPGPTPPTDPVVGDFWFDTSTGQLYIWWDDGVNRAEWTKSSTPNANYMRYIT